MGNAHTFREKPAGGPEHIEDTRKRMNGYRLRCHLLETVLCCKEIELTAWRKGLDPALARSALIGGMSVDGDGTVNGAEEALSRHLLTPR